MVTDAQGQVAEVLHAPNLEHVATGYVAQHVDIALVVTSPSPAAIWEAEETLRFVHATKLTNASTKKVWVPSSRP
jgi:hypothetical protein